jgi:hypothetical protein
MAGSDKSEGLPWGFDKRNTSKADDKKKTDDNHKSIGQGTSSGETDKTKTGQKPVLLDMFKVVKHPSGNVYLPPDLWKK